MAKWVCTVCGYIYEGEQAPEKCPQCGVPASKFKKQEEGMTWAAEHGATEGKFDLAKRAKAANLDAIHDTVHEMAKDEARHGRAFEGLLKRYFG